MVPPPEVSETAPAAPWLGARDFRWLVSAGLLVGMSATAALVRYAVIGQTTWTFLVKNLLLAAIPAVLALVLQRFANAPRVMFGSLLLLWLLFLPNAPYIVTDVIHLSTPRRTVLWMDVLIVGGAALAGLLLTFASTRWALVALARRLRRPVIPRTAYIAVAFVGALGVYFGRFARWNSWDVVTRPGALAEDFLKRIATTDPWVFTAIFGSCLAIGQVVFWLVTNDSERSRPDDHRN
jgi:uncharacterized membrane protein